MALLDWVKSLTSFGSAIGNKMHQWIDRGEERRERWRGGGGGGGGGRDGWRE